MNIQHQYNSRSVRSSAQQDLHGACPGPTGALYHRCSTCLRLVTDGTRLFHCPFLCLGIHVIQSIPSLSHTPIYTLPPVPQTFEPLPSANAPESSDTSASSAPSPNAVLIPSEDATSSSITPTTTFRDALPAPLPPSPSSPKTQRRASLSARDQLLPPTTTPDRTDSFDQRRDSLTFADEQDEKNGQAAAQSEKDGIAGSTSRLHDELTEQLAQVRRRCIGVDLEGDTMGHD